MELIKNDNVLFNEEKHLYTLIDDETFTAKPLMGVTQMIKTLVCPNLYKDVDEATLLKAAHKGSHLHKLCEKYDDRELAMDIANIPELIAYMKLLEDNKIKIIASEYLVSDNNNFASCIDKVVELDDKSVAIIDLKFTYTFNEEPVMWQTSLYADWFEKQNPGIKVKQLQCIHIHQYKDSITADIHDLQRVPSEYLEQLCECWLMRQAGVEWEFINPMKMGESCLDWEEEKEQKLIELNKTLKKLSNEKDTLIREMKERFTLNPDTRRYVGKFLTFSQSLTKHKLVFDEERFMCEHPDLYKQYMTKDKVTAGRTTLSIN